MISVESMSLAADAGLNYVTDEIPGDSPNPPRPRILLFRPPGKGDQWLGPEWIDSLVIPPAWTDVWISPDRSGHILATGYDEAGRKQYIYHPVWEETRDEVKFERMGEFGRRLTQLRRRTDSELSRQGLSRLKVTALAVAVMDRTLIRVGNRKYADENDAYGLTTITCDHVEVDGLHVHLEFVGKGGRRPSARLPGPTAGRSHLAMPGAGWPDILRI